jgi:transglutaminase-like putative cysteine protease
LSLRRGEPSGTYARVRRLQIDHLTEYRFGSQVTLLPHKLLLRPRENHSLRILSSKLDISPAPRLRWQRDALDNSLAVASFSAPSDTLRIASQVVIEHYDEEPLDFLVESHAMHHPFAYRPDEFAELAPLCLMAWPLDHAVVDGWLRAHGIGLGTVETFAMLDKLNRIICRDFRYQVREEPGVQSPALTITRGSGSCRDFAALFLDACRHLGLASRFVTGYHTSYANDASSGSTHAWAEVYLPGPGWKGFDPTAGLITGSEHITVAVARHPETVPPVAGSYLGSASPIPTMLVNVRVFAV